MKITNWAGVAVFLVGMVIMGAYSIYPLFNSQVEESTILFGMRVSMVLMGIGAAILIITMSVERYKEWKKMKEEISEDDLRP
jgi:anaerobic C4-dicarboxylate transporter